MRFDGIQLYVFIFIVEKWRRNSSDKRIGADDGISRAIADKGQINAFKMPHAPPATLKCQHHSSKTESRKLTWVISQQSCLLTLNNYLIFHWDAFGKTLRKSEVTTLAYSRVLLVPSVRGVSCCTRCDPDR